MEPGWQLLSQTGFKGETGLLGGLSEASLWDRAVSFPEGLLQPQVARKGFPSLQSRPRPLE